MKTRHSRLAWLSSLLTLAMVVALGSCASKKASSDISGSGGGADVSAATPAAPTPQPADTQTRQGANVDMQTAYFDYDSATLTKEGRKALKQNAKWMKKTASVAIQIEGHCDERGSVEYNLALGEKRAKAAKQYMVKLGVEASRISVISYGKERPADPGHDEAAWSKNRRAAAVVTSSTLSMNQ